MADSAFPSSFPSQFRLRQLVALVALAWGIAPSVQAQPVPGVLKEVVVSGSRSEQDKDDVPATIEVIGSEALESRQVGDIRDLVRDIPNMSVQRSPARFTAAASNTGRDGNAGFNIRGLDGNRVLILTDGIRMPRSYAFSANAFGRDYVDMTLLKRVEIVKGPASALYGSDGMAGMVNFITLQPEDFLTGGKTIGGRAGVSYSGDDAGLGVSATVAGKASDTLQWLLSTHLSGASELDNQGTNDAASIDRTTPNPQKDRNKSLLGKLVFRPDATQKHTFTLEHADKHADYNLLSARARLPLTGTATQIANATLAADSFTTMDRDRLTWEGRYRLNAALADSVQSVVSLQRAHSREYVAEDRNTSADRVRDVTYDEDTLQLGLQAEKLVRATGGSGGMAQKITYGMDYVGARVINLNTGVTPAFGETFPLKRFPDTRETSTALYVQDEFIADQWSISPALRWDHFSIKASQAGFSPPSTTPAASLSGSAVSPKLGVLYRATPHWSVYGNYASGFRAPNAGQVNAFFENLTSFYKTIPNPNLRPEKSRNIELGARARLDSLTLDMAAFTGRYTDLILDSQQVGGSGVAGNPTIFQSINIGNATIHGFEIKGQYQWGSFAGGQISSPFSYGQTQGTDNSTGKPINSIDPAKLSLGVAYQTAVWDLRLDLTRHAGKSAADIDSAALVASPATQFTIPAATTLDVSGQWRIRKDLRLNVAINNLTDKKYWKWSDVRGLSAASTVTDAYTQAGRHVNVSLVADF